MTVVPIADLVAPVTRKGPSQDSTTFTYVDLSAVDAASKRIVAPSEVPTSEAPSRARQNLHSGDVLVSTVRPNLNGVALVEDHLDGAVGSTAFAVLRAKDDQLDQRYLFHWVRTPQFVESMTRLATGASYPAVTETIVKASQLPLPPLPEQRRIAAILDEADTLHARLDSRIRTLRELPFVLFRYQFAASAESTMVPLRALTRKIGSGATPRGGRDAYRGGTTNLIRSMNVHDNRFERDGLVQIDDAQAYALRSVAVEPLDVLLNITGASVARVCNAPLDVLPARVNQHVAIIRTTSDLDPVFLAHQLASSSAKRRLLHGASNAGATREAITKADIERFEVLVPPAAKQIQFRTAVLSAEDSLRSLGEERRRLKELFVSLQQRAFRGEL